MKERLTSFDIAALTFEINQLIESARISKIYQTNNVLVLNLVSFSIISSILLCYLHRPSVNHKGSLTTTPPIYFLLV